MLARLRKRLTFANVVSLIALFVALGGASYAAVKLKKDSVTAKHLAPNSVGTEEANNLTKDDFSPGQLPVGETGPQGPPGQDGQPGQPGSAVAFAHVNADGTLDTANSKNITASRLHGPLTNYYCVDVAVPFQNVTATADSLSQVFVSAILSDPFTSCPPVAEDVVFQTWRHDGVAVGSAFWAVFN
jgi:hypothetical protein